MKTVTKLFDLLRIVIGLNSLYCLFSRYSTSWRYRPLNSKKERGYIFLRSFFAEKNITRGKFSEADREGEKNRNSHRRKQQQKKDS